MKIPQGTRKPPGMMRLPSKKTIARLEKLPPVTPVCRATHMGGECEGPLRERPRYYITGASYYACRRHAAILLAVNPLGPPFKD